MVEILSMRLGLNGVYLYHGNLNREEDDDKAMDLGCPVFKQTL